jgi:hypothetical protein
MSHCSSWSERSGALGGTVSLHLIPRIGGLHRDALQLVRVGSVSWLAPAVRFGKDQFVACGSVQFNGNLQNVCTPTATSRLIDFFNRLADASITKKLLREIERFSHDLYVTRASTTLYSHAIRYSPMLNNEVLTPSHVEAKTQGDLKASVAALQTQLESRIHGARSNFELRRKESDDLRRGAAWLSPNGRASATVSYLSRKL